MPNRDPAKAYMQKDRRKLFVVFWLKSTEEEDYTYG
jgi:hypothetical protein